MKIGIVTHYYNNRNFGGNLQAYALVKAIEKYTGGIAEQIAFQFASPCLKKGLRFFLTELLKTLRRPKRLVVSVKQLYIDAKPIEMKSLRNVIDMLLHRKYWKRDRVLSNFNDSIPHSDCIYNGDSISSCNEKYDAFITGSDQVWSGCCEAFVLGFVQNKAKISYAASIGRSSISGAHKEFLSKHICDFSAISVRSQTDYGIVSSLTKDYVQIVVDPVFLLSSLDWNALAKNRRKEKKKYIFCYFLGDSLEVKKATKKFAQMKNLPILFVPNFKDNENGFVDNDLILGGNGRYDISPADFVGLIRDAEYIFTDSFHCVAFSLIYHKEFYAFDRVSKWGVMNSRIIDLLTEVGCGERFYSIDSSELLYKKMIETNRMDFSECDAVINEKRKKSIDFLVKSIVK